MNKNLTLAAATLLCSCALTMAARADDGAAISDGPFEIRLRAAYLDMLNHSDAIAALAVPENAIHVNSKWLPDLDFEYYFLPNWSAELVATYPQKQTVTVEQSALGGATNIGTFKHLPPTLTVKYGFLPNSVFRPYVGVGINVTAIFDQNIAVPTVGRLDLDHTSVGFAGQVGFDYKIADHWFANLDAKWIQIGSDVKLDGTQISTVHLNPWLLGFGVGYRF